MDVGVVSRSFPEMDNQQTAAFMKENNFTSTELCLTATDSNYWRYNNRSDLSDMSDERFAGIVQTYRDAGINVTSIGVFTNLINPDDKEREANLEYFAKHIQWAGQNKIPFVATECGFDPDHRGVRTLCYESAIDLIKDSYRYLIKHCELWDVSLAIETCVIDVIPSAKRANDIIHQVGSSRLKVLLDPANLIANSSEADMFHYLRDHIAYFHGKDRRVNDVYGRCVGDGEIDWPYFLSLYHKYTEGTPFILEYVNAGNVCSIRDRVLKFDEMAQRLLAAAKE